MEKNRGRVETRTVTTTTNLIESGYLKWPGAQQLMRLERHTVEKGKVRSSVTYYVTSLKRSKANAARLLSLARHRWWIESKFWMMDNILGSDASRLRTGHAAHALSAIHHFTLNTARRLRQPCIAFLQENAAKVTQLLSRLRIPT